jgi:type VI secretion system protein ImpK
VGHSELTHVTRKPDDPFATGDAMSDATILRPRPRRRPVLVRPGEPLPDRAQPAPPGDGRRPAVAASATGASAAQAVAPADIPAGSTNPLLHAAVPLLALAAELRGRSASADVDAVRQHCVQEIRNFEEPLRRAVVPAEDVLAARYALCTVIDEAVLNTPWGARSGWAGQSLLVTFHRESSGGEKFFQILDRVLREPQRYVALLEVLHACLALGFEGRYRLEERGPAKLAEIRQNVYRITQSVRGSAETDLSPHWRGVEDRRNAVVRFVPLWVVAAACGVMLLGAFLLFRAWLDERTDGINAQLASVGMEPLYTAAPVQPGPRVSFRTLLAPQIGQGLVGVDERDDGRTFITLTAPDLFASASETMNARYRDLISAVGRAAQQVPGRLTVVGHTDDQPVRSLRFADNYELSRVRALEVANLLRGSLREPDRVDFIGKGDAEPRYLPPSLPDNRARNRRVEIIHRREG